jgi:hypothetical protein
MDARVTRESGNGTKRRRIELPLGVTLRRTTVLRDGRLTGDSGSAEDLNGMSRDSSSTISPHKRIRAELGFAAEEARDIEALLQQAIAATATPSAIPPAPISPTSARSSRSCTPRRSASRSPRSTRSTPSSRPRPSS